MQRRRSGAAREAARRAAQPPRPPRASAVRAGPATAAPVPPARVPPAAPDPLADIERLRRRLAALDRRRRELVVERDELVDVARAAGVSWNVLAAAAGTTRQALIRRHGEQGSRP